jgi:hypothetical protein
VRRKLKTRKSRKVLRGKMTRKAFRGKQISPQTENKNGKSALISIIKNGSKIIYGDITTDQLATLT